ncbi:MAG: type II secretion system protein GspM [Pseudomonadota bacterium]
MNKERKIIISIGIVLLVVAFVYRYAPDVQSFLVDEDAIALKMKKLQQQTQLIARKDNYQARHDGTAALLANAENWLLTGETPAMAAVDMQNIIKAVVYKAGLEVASFQVLKASDPDTTGYVGIPVKFQVVSTARQLKDILYGIEGADKLFQITEINSRLAGRYQPGVPIMVRSVITVEGYVAGG